MFNRRKNLKRKCFFKKNHIKFIDYKDVELLKKFVMPNGKILPSRNSGVSYKYQRQLSKAIKKARFMGLLPYIVH